MPDDIVRNMRLRPDFSELPVPDWSPSQMAGGVEKGIDFAYGLARAPLTASEDIARQTREQFGQPDIARSMTAQPIPQQATIRQAPPGMGVQSPIEKVSRAGLNIMEMADPLAQTAIAKKLATGAMGAITAPQVSQKLRTIAQHRAKALGTDVATEARGLSKLQEWIPQWVWDDLQELRGTSSTRVGGRYYPTKSQTAQGAAVKGAATKRGGIMEIAVQAKDPLGSGAHEGGHLISEVVRNYSRGKPGLEKLSNRLKNMDLISDRAKALQNRIAYMATGTGTEASKAQYLKRLSTRAYLTSPDEHIARQLRKSFEAGESFDAGIRKGMKKSMDEYLQAEAVLDMVEAEAKKLDPRGFKEFGREHPKIAEMGGRAQKADVVRGALPQLKGALSRGTLEKRLLKLTEKMSKASAEQYRKTMKYMTPQDLLAYIKKLEGR